jgi:hypothetical protein
MRVTSGAAWTDHVGSWQILLQKYVAPIREA